MLIDANNQKIINNMRIQANMCYTNAELIRIAVGSILNDEVKFPQIYDVFPDLFEKPVEKPKQQDWRVMKEILMDHAKLINSGMLLI